MKRNFRFFLLTVSAILVIAAFANVKECSAIDFVDNHDHSQHDNFDNASDNAINPAENSTDTELIQDNGTDKEENAEAAFIAIVTFNQGRNKVTRKDGTIAKCQIDLTLFEGDKIEVHKRGKVSIVYKKSGIYYALKPEETLIISAEDETKKQEIDLTKVNEAIVKNINSNNGKPIISAVAGTRERKDPNHPFPLSLRNTNIMFTDKLTFTWEAPDGLNLKDEKNPIKFRVHILHKGEELKVFTTEGATLTIEMAKNGLVAGELYYWYVERTDMPRIATVKPFFKVMTKDETESVNKILTALDALKTDENDGSYLVMKARVMMEKALFQDAIATLKKCYAMIPGDEGLLDAMDKTYQAQGFYPEDIQRFIKALKEAHPVIDDENAEGNQTQPNKK